MDNVPSGTVTERERDMDILKRFGEDAEYAALAGAVKTGSLPVLVRGGAPRFLLRPCRGYGQACGHRRAG